MLKLEEFFKSNSRILVKLISKRYPLSEYQLEKYKSFLLWDEDGVSSNYNIKWNKKLFNRYNCLLSFNRFGIGGNKSIPWDEQLINEYSSILNWDDITLNEGIKWNKSLIHKFINNINWRLLPDNPSITIDLNLLNEFASLWHFGDELNRENDGFYISGISGSKNVKWSNELIKKYKDLLNWTLLSENSSIKFSYGLIERFINYWNFDKLSGNKSIAIDEDFINRYAHLIKFDKLSYIFPYDKALINKYKTKLDWGILSIRLPWSEEDIYNYPEINKKIISYNEKIEWTDSLWRKVKSDLDWKSLLKYNSSFVWTESRLKEYITKYGTDDISRTRKIKWNKRLINEFESFLNFDELSEIGNLSNPEAIEASSKWNFSKLGNNILLPFEINFLYKYRTEIDFSNHIKIYYGQYIDLINDELIAKILG